MVKVLIVDDEILVRVGMKSFIQWEKLGLTLVGEASNGMEAIRLIESERPDIILLDIKMPEMDGLQLLTIMKEKQIEAKVIILSCYDEYEYVRKALKLGAVDYILKLSFKSDELNNLLLNTRDSIVEKIINNKDGGSIGERQDRFIKDLLKSDYNDRMKYYCKKSVGEQYSKISTTTCFISRFQTTTKKEAKEFAVFNIINEALKDIDNAFSIALSSDTTIVVFTEVISLTSLQDNIESISDIVNVYLKENILVGISDFFSGLDNFKRALSQCQYSLEYLFYSAEANKMMYYMDTRQFCKVNNVYNKEIAAKLYNNILNNDEQGTYTIINSIFNIIITERNIKPQVIKDIVIDIISSFSRVLYIYGYELYDFREVSPYVEIMRINNIFQIKQWVNEFIDEFFNYIKRISYYRYRDEINEARRYIQDNYSDDISLSTVAKHVNMSENYFSTVYKETTHESYSNYLNRIRIEKAKELLLKYDYKAYEVAYMVGYKNATYFSKIFKKITGINVSEFQRVKE